MGTRASRKARASREAERIALQYEPSARDWFPELVEVLTQSRPVLAIHDEGTPQERVEYGAPTYRNVGAERARTPHRPRRKLTQTERRRARRRVSQSRTLGEPAAPSRKALKRAGVKIGPAPKVPTPHGERLHGWTVRTRKGKVEIRPSRIGIARYGIRDLGWKQTKAYWTKSGALRKAARA